jgi:hypothetical protein
MPAPRTVVLLAVALATAIGLTAVPAQASTSQRSVFEDDHLLLNSGDALREQTLDDIKALGADTIHVLVIWNKLAPAPNAGTKPAVDASDPNSYAGWGPWDAVVAGAQARGLKVLLTPTGPAPTWASLCKGSVTYRKRCSPRVSDWSAFVKAVATRYPSVHEWSFWNEPNHSSWLVPQTGTSDGVKVNLAAMRYRKLVLAGTKALGQTGHGSDTVLMGETAPLGGSHSTAPVDFYRELFCLDRSYRPFTGRAARARGCSARPHFYVDGVSHHPYAFAGIAKPSVLGRASDAPIGALGRVVTVLDYAARYGIVPRRLPLWLTEFGYQTHPPDPFGVSLAQQARYINEADYIAYMNPRVASVAQYTLRDDPSRGGFNTGLEFAKGQPKPALAAYALPIWVVRTAHGHGKVFGQVRAADGRVVTVALQHRTSGRGAWRTVASVRTNRSGYFLRRFGHIGGQWRLKYGARYSRGASA